MWALKTFGGEESLLVPETVIALFIGFALLAWFIIRCLRSSAPLLDIGLFRNRPFSAGIIAALASTFAIAGALLLLAQWIQIVGGASPVQAGIRLFPVAIASAIASLSAPHWPGGSVREPCSVVSPPSCIVLNSQARGYSRQPRQQINASFPKYSTLLAPRQQCHSNSPCPNSSLQRASRSPTLCRSRGSLAAASCCSPQSWSFYSPRKEETSRRPRTN